MNKVLFLFMSAAFLHFNILCADSVDLLMQGYEKQCGLIDASAAKKKQMLAKQLVTKLQSQLRMKTRKGDLDGALKIKKIIEELQTSLKTQDALSEESCPRPPGFEKDAISLKLNDIIPTDKVNVIGKNIKIHAEFISRKDDGVIIAHGDQNSGYCLFLKNGQVVLLTRSPKNGASALKTTQQIKKYVLTTVEAQIQKNGRLSLKVNQSKEIAKSAPPITTQPADNLSVGIDDGGKVAKSKYEKFYGKINLLLLKIE